MAALTSDTSCGYHQVFISHHGVEMKFGFASCLCQALEDRGITTFLDAEDFPRGDMLEAARKAVVGVPIFNKEYGTSSWCLDELAAMMDRKRNGENRVIPVFFDVMPEELRNEEGEFAEKLKRYVGKCMRSEDDIRRWKGALKEASWLAGFGLGTYGGNQGPLIRHLVMKIREEIWDSQVFITDKFKLAPEFEVLSVGNGCAKNSNYSKRVIIKTILGRQDGGVGLIGQRMTIGGWVKTGREQGKGSFAFLDVNDGSCMANLQVLVDASVAPLNQLTPTGTCILAEGELTQPPKGAKQMVEFKVDKVLELGLCDSSTYPIPKTKHSLENLRNFLHLRARTNTIGAVARIRNALAFATHTFFQQNGFLYVHTPIITSSDCEGAGEMFNVTTLFSDAERRQKEAEIHPPPSDVELEEAKRAIIMKGETVKELKKNGSKADIEAAVCELEQAKELLGKLEEWAKFKPGIAEKNGAVDYSADFFARQAYLTVSGQLQVETYACAVSNVYTFSPTFRAENSHTNRHLAEFWMIEPEICFADLKDAMNCAEDYVKFLCKWLLEHCRDDMEFMRDKIDKAAISRLDLVATAPFSRISYTKAIEILQQVTGKKFENKVEWGIDLASEHERYLTEEIFKNPVIVYNYPKDIKAFYMRLNSDGKTVAAMDVLVPKVGELVGGSQREERLQVLEKRLSELGLPKQPYEWYLDLRKYGTVKHAGFGLGFERMILFATGLENIRDTIPFPRYPGKAEF